MSPFLLTMLLPQLPPDSTVEGPMTLLRTAACQRRLNFL